MASFRGQLNTLAVTAAPAGSFLGQKLRIHKASFQGLRCAAKSNSARSLQVVSKKMVGIDLGTTNSKVAVMDERGLPTIITTVPSNLDKRIIEENKISAKDLFQYRVLARDDHDDDDIVAPEQILLKLKDQASKYLKDQVTEVVVTVPWSFNDSQRSTVKDAAHLAGF